MTRKVVTAAPDTPLNEVANLLEVNSIKRIPIIESETVVGIVTRANLIQAIASLVEPDIHISDTELRTKLLAHLNSQRWALALHLNVIVHQSVAELWGIAGSEAERNAIRAAAESIGGIRRVNNHVVVRPKK